MCLFYSSFPIHAMAVDSNAQVRSTALQSGSSDAVTSKEASSSDRYMNLLYWSVPEFYRMTQILFKQSRHDKTVPSISLRGKHVLFFLHPSGCIIAILGDKSFLLKRVNSIASERTV